MQWVRCGSVCTRRYIKFARGILRGLLFGSVRRPTRRVGTDGIVQGLPGRPPSTRPRTDIVPGVPGRPLE